MADKSYERCGCGKGSVYACRACNPPPPPPQKCSCGCNQTPQNCPNR